MNDMNETNETNETARYMEGVPAYVANAARGDARCLVCQSPDIEGGPVEIEADYAYQEMKCLRCDAAWDDVYRLQGVRNLDHETPIPF